MKQDQAILYKALYEEVNNAIKNINTLGFDTTLLEEELKSINSEVTNNVKTNYIKSMAEASLINFYLNGIKRLNTLKNKLDYFNIYFKAYHICESISFRLNEKTTKEDLEKIVSKMCYILSEINKSSTIDYDSESKIVEKMYEVAYNIIKYEIIMNRKSALFDFIKNTDINTIFFNSLILKDIESIDLRKEEYKEIKIKVSYLMENGIYSNYFDFDLIKLIVLYDKNIDLKKSITIEINHLFNEIISNKDLINQRVSVMNDLQKKINDYKNDICCERKKLLVRLPFISIILAGYIAGGFGIQKGVKKLATQELYNKTTITYSSLADEYNEKKEVNIIKSSDDKDKQIAIVYLEPNKNNKRKYYKYDLSKSNVDFKTLKEYYEYGIENLGIKYFDAGKIETNKSKDGYVEIIDIKYEDLDKTNCDKTDYTVGLLCFYILYAAILSLLTWRLSKTDFLWYDIKDAFKYLKKYKNKKRNSLNELKAVVNEIINEINKNEELRIEFNKLYEENKYLLNNPEELMNKIDEIDFEEVKKLVKKYN